MTADVQRMMELVHRVQAAWDQYTLQPRLPEDGGWRTQGHAWDPYNKGRQIVQARRDPVAVSAAWNDVEEGLRELSATASRLAGLANVPAAATPQPAWYDRRVGPYSALPGLIPAVTTAARPEMEVSLPAA
jgi:hypothetical protein